MLLGAQHLALHDTSEFTGVRRHAIDLKTGHRQTSNQLVPAYLRAYPAAQPLFTEFHPALLLDSLRVCGLAKLRKEPQVVVEEQAQVIYTVTKHGQTLDAHAESTTR